MIGVGSARRSHCHSVSVRQRLPLILPTQLKQLAVLLSVQTHGVSGPFGPRKLSSKSLCCMTKGSVEVQNPRHRPPLAGMPLGSGSLAANGYNVNQDCHAMLMIIAKSMLLVKNVCIGPFQKDSTCSDSQKGSPCCADSDHNVCV